MNNLPQKAKTIFYIDGYNWYHAIFKHRPEWKWLNIQAFCESLCPDDDVLSVKMFSALINDPEAQERQKKYFLAIQTFPKVKLILGFFQGREVSCRADCELKYVVQEEKKTDVNIAVEMMEDAVFRKCTKMVVVTGDCDVQPQIEWISQNVKEIAIEVYIPALSAEMKTRRTDYYKTKGLRVKACFLPTATIPEHQMPGTVKIAPDKVVCRPFAWMPRTPEKPN